MKKTILSISGILSILALSAQFAVGTRTITFNDPARTGGFGSGGGTGRQVQTEIFYPATTAGTNVAVASGNFPVIVFGHGFVMTYDVYKPIYDSLVMRGYVVALPRTEGSIAPAPVHIDFGKDLALVLNKLIALNDSASSVFYQKLNGRGAIGGHSMGGGSTFLADSFTTKALCYFTMAAAETNPKSSTAAKRNKKPHLIISGTRDCVAPQATNQNLMYDSLLLSPCKTQVYLSGGYHCQFNNSSTTCNFGESTCKVNGGLSLAAQLGRVNQYITPFLDYYLKGDCNAWTSFQQKLSTAAPDSFRQSCNVVIPSNAQLTSPAFICSGTSTKLKVTPVGFLYSWNGGPSIAADSFVISQAGSYNVVVGNGTCSLPMLSSSVAAKTNPAQPIFSSVADTLCAGGGNVVYNINTVPGALSYSWQLPIGWSKIGGDSTTNLTIAYGAIGGSIAVFANNECGSSTVASKVITVTETPTFAGSQASIPVQVCPNTSNILLVAPDLASATRYTWSLPQGWTYLSGNGRDSIIVSVGANGGTAYTTVSGFCGTGIDSFSNQINVNANATPVAPSFSGNTSYICKNSLATFTVVSAAGADYYLWQLPSGWSIISGDSSSSITVQSNSIAGTVSVAAVNSCGTSVASVKDFTIDSIPVFSGNNLSTTRLICEGSTDVLFVSPLAANATSYQWTAPNNWTVKSTNGRDSLIVDVTSSGAVYNTATGNCGSSLDSFAINVSIAPNPEPVVSQSGNVLISSIQGVSYTWSRDGQIIQGQSDSLTVSLTGDYTVTVIDGNGCSGSSQSFTYIAQPNGIDIIGERYYSAYFEGDELVIYNFGNGYNWKLFNVEGKEIANIARNGRMAIPGMASGLYFVNGLDHAGLIKLKVIKRY